MKANFSSESAGADAMSMDALLEQYFKTPSLHHGDIVSGIIVSVSPQAILIDVGDKHDALVIPKDLEVLTPEQWAALRPGRRVSVYVVEIAESEGVIYVSLLRAEQQRDWDEAFRLLESKETVELPVVEANRGGVLVQMGKLRGFVPGSQLSPTWRSLQRLDDPDLRWAALVGKKLRLRVLEVIPERNRLILSERTVPEQRLRKRELLNALQPEQIYEGVVTNVVDYGAFVTINGVEGLIHISELSWRRVTDPRTIVQVGQTVRVKLLEVNLASERLSLSLKRVQPDPWQDVEKYCQEGAIVEVCVTSLAKFGAFVALTACPDIEGLVHLSELSAQPIERPEQIVNVGERRMARVLSCNAAERRIAFSFKQVATG